MKKSHLTSLVLHDIADEVKTKEEALQVIEALKEELELHNALGIAAPQIGISKRVVLCKIKGDFVAMINPTFTTKLHDKRVSKEGCLSFPNRFCDKIRDYRIVVEYVDENFNKCLLRLSGKSSYIVQHEIDHLNGKTIF